MRCCDLSLCSLCCSWMLRLGVKRALSSTVALSATHRRTLALCARKPPSSPPRSPYRHNLAHLPARARDFSHATHSIMTVTDPHYKPDAPYAFVTQPGSAIEHLAKDEWDTVEARDGLPAYAVYRKEIEKSQNDDRVYRCARRDRESLPLSG